MRYLKKNLTFYFFSGMVWVALIGESAFAYEPEYRPLYRGARAMAMGGSYVALADDEQAIFYNPAGMAGIRTPQFRYASMDAVVGTSLINKYEEAAAQVAEISGVSADSLNILMGKDIYSQGQLAATLVAPNVGFAYLIDGQGSFMLRNSAAPVLDMGYQITHGVQIATGISLAGRRQKKRWDFRVGVAGKWMYRRGGYETLHLSEVMQIRKDFLATLAPGFGSGYGGDLGVQAIRYLDNRRWKLMAGAAFTDVGSTIFTGAEKVDNQQGNLSAGVAAQLKVGEFLTTTLSYEMNQINYSNIDWRKRNHIGFEMTFPFISLMGGINQVFLTYGARFDLWIFNITLYSYQEELNTLVNQYPQRRYGINATLKFDI